MKNKLNMEKLVSLCKRRGFVFPTCEIYGGMANAYTYGPYGVELKNNIKKLWWKKFITEREDIVGIDGPILLNPKVWQASGHTEGFNDAMVDCKECKKRFRADHLIEESTGEDVEGDLHKMNEILINEKIKCPSCGKKNWSEARNFNMMFKTQMNGMNEDVYLRPETAGAIFVEFKNIIDSVGPKIPFGIGQIGKAFRNEIIAGNFIFRLREFEQLEIEYFIDPESNWLNIFEEWLSMQEEFAYELGAKKENIRRREHSKEKLSHYSKKTVDIEYNFPMGWKELFGLANRTDFDLKAHNEYSGKKIEYYDQENNRKFIPHVIEPTFGLDRSILVALSAAYDEELLGNGETRTVLRFPAKIAPVQVAVFPLLKNKKELTDKARKVFNLVQKHFSAEYDDGGNIGKRYRKQDEIGTPFCITVDYDSLKDESVTVRNRDTMRQERISIDELINFISDNFS